MSLLIAEMSPTSHVVDHVLWSVGGTPVLTTQMVTMVIAGFVTVFLLWIASRAIVTGPESEGNARYVTKGKFAQLIEAMVVYLRNEMLLPVMGEHSTRKYLPYLLSLFFFILTMNLFGIVPFADMQALLYVFFTGSDNYHHYYFGGTATANIAITCGLAMISFVVIQVHGFRELGVKGFLEHMTGGLIDGPIGLWLIIPIVFAVEIAGLFIKPAALAIRLFANMVGGHTMMGTLLLFGYMAFSGGLGLLGGGTITLVSTIFTVMISFLEIFVAFLQAFIFMFLTAVFISLMSHEEHELELEEAEDAKAAVAGH